MFIRIQIGRKSKFYVWIIISGSKNVKEGQKKPKKAKKKPKKATNWTYNAFSKKFFGWANLKYINSYNVMKKKFGVIIYIIFRSYFFPFNEVEI